MKFNAVARGAMVVVAVAMTAAVSVGVAAAVLQANTVASYTGCLTPGGTIVNLAVGDTPTRDCGTAQVVHLGGGDITAVLTPAGSGLTGGADNGTASLSLDSAGCSAGGVLKFNGGAWACSTDNNTTYSAGLGLDLTGLTFSIDPGFQLPQDCADGQVARLNTPTGRWACSDVTATQFQVVEGDPVIVSTHQIGDAYAFCPDGTSITGGGYNTDGQIVIHVFKNRPLSVSMGDQRTGWTITVLNDVQVGAGTELTIKAFAICASP